MTATTCAPNPTVTDAHCAEPAGLTDVIRRETKALSLNQIATLLSVSRGKIYNLVQAGQIPHLRIGATIRFDPQAVASWLEAKQVQ
jgi:excisionase family DNA binding protein